MMKTRKQFVICLNNQDYPASLEIRKVYEVLPDEKAASRGFVRVVDESGEDYLYPTSYFAPIELSEDVERVLQLSS